VLASSQRSIGAALQQATSLPARTHQQLTLAAKTAFVHGVNVANLVAVGVALIAAGLAYWLLPRPVRPDRLTEVAAEPSDGDGHALDQALAS
jgi:hypothetical protein